MEASVLVPTDSEIHEASPSLLVSKGDSIPLIIVQNVDADHRETQSSQNQVVSSDLRKEEEDMDQNKMETIITHWKKVKSTNAIESNPSQPMKNFAKLSRSLADIVHPQNIKTQEKPAEEVIPEDNEFKEKSIDFRKDRVANLGRFQNHLKPIFPKNTSKLQSSLVSETQSEFSQRKEVTWKLHGSDENSLLSGFNATVEVVKINGQPLKPLKSNLLQDGRKDSLLATLCQDMTEQKPRMHIRSRSEANIPPLRTLKHCKRQKAQDSSLLSTERRSLSIEQQDLSGRHTMSTGRLMYLTERRSVSSGRQLSTDRRSTTGNQSDIDLLERSELYFQKNRPFLNDFNQSIQKRIITQAAEYAKRHKQDLMKYTAPRRSLPWREKSVTEELEEFEKQRERLRGFMPFFGRNRFLYKIDPTYQISNKNLN